MSTFLYEGRGCHRWYVFVRSGVAGSQPWLVAGPFTTYEKALRERDVWNANKQYATTEVTVANIVFPSDTAESK